jgi:hypothetical protein
MKKFSTTSALNMHKSAMHRTPPDFGPKPPKSTLSLPEKKPSWIVRVLKKIFGKG